MFLALRPLSGASTILARSVGCGFRQTSYDSGSKDEVCNAQLIKQLAQRKRLINDNRFAVLPLFTLLNPEK